MLPFTPKQWAFVEQWVFSPRGGSRFQNPWMSSLPKWHCPPGGKQPVALLGSKAFLLPPKEEEKTCPQALFQKERQKTIWMCSLPSMIKCIWHYWDPRPPSPLSLFFFTEQAHIHCLDPPLNLNTTDPSTTHTTFCLIMQTPRCFRSLPKGTSLSKEGNKEVNEIVPQISGLVSPP
jgi:hypothetical protein